MSAQEWDEMGEPELGSNKIARSPTAFALYMNPIAIAQRGTGAPWLNGIGAVEQLTGSGNYVVPAGVYRLLLKVKGAGASGRSSTVGSAGGSTTFGGITAPGGNPPGSGNPAEYQGGFGGVPSASTGVLTEVLISGADGQDGTGQLALSPTFGGRGGGSVLADGGDGAIAVIEALKLAMPGRGFGGGGGGHATAGPRGWGGGGEGAFVIAVMAVAPGQSIPYSIGAGGTHSQAGNGTAGTIIVEY